MSTQSDIDTLLAGLKAAADALTPALPQAKAVSGVLGVLKALVDAFEAIIAAPAQPNVPETTLVHQATDQLAADLSAPAKS